MKEACLELDMLARYIGGTLSPGQKDQVERHLAVCDECREDFLITNRLIRDEDPEEWEPIPVEHAQSLWEEFRKKICAFREWTRTFVSDLARESQFAWAGLVPVRDAESPAVDYIHLAKDIGAIRTEFFIEKKGGDNVSLKIRTVQDGEHSTRLRLTLKRKEGRDISRHIRGDYALFENLPLGLYRLRLIQHRPNKPAPDQGVSEQGTYNYFFEISEAGFDEKTRLFYEGQG